MIAMLMCCAFVAADLDVVPPPPPPPAKEPPRMMVVRLQGDKLLNKTTVAVSVPVTVTEAFLNKEGKQETRTVTRYVSEKREVENSYDLKTVTVTTAGGKKLDADEVKKRLARPRVVVVSNDGGAVDRVYLDALDKETLVIVPALKKKK